MDTRTRNVLIAVFVAAALGVCGCCGATGLFALLSGGGSAVTLKGVTRSDDPVKRVAVQLALRKVVAAHRRAMLRTAVALCEGPSDAPMPKWTADYRAAQAAWKDAASAAAELDALGAKLPDYAEPDVSFLPTERSVDGASLFAPTVAYAKTPLPASLPMEAWKAGPDAEVSLDVSKEAKAAIADRTKASAVVMAFDAAPPGKKISAIAGYYEGDANKASAALQSGFKACADARTSDGKFYDVASRIATAIEAAADVALYVGDLATGGGKVSLGKAVSRQLVRRLITPRNLAKNAVAALGERPFTMVIGNVDTAIGLMGKGVVVATGEEAAPLTWAGRDSGAVNTVITLANFRDPKGWVSNVAQAAKDNPGTWKSFYGMGALAGDLTQLGVNGLQVDADGDTAKLEPAPIGYADAPDGLDLNAASAAADRSYAEALQMSNDYQAANAAVLGKWTGPETYLVADPQPVEESPANTGGAEAGGLAGTYAGTIHIGPPNHKPEATFPVPITIEVRSDGTFTATAKDSGTPPALYRSEFAATEYRFDAKWTGTVSADGSLKGTGTEERDVRANAVIGVNGWLDEPPQPSTITGRIESGRFTGSTSVQGIRIEASKGN
ncbi:MAG: hypothetical protein Q7W30_02500 [Coriobacteriia bacterium]|nr:hypothetical protein [Coriobacteriia bacterium]